MKSIMLDGQEILYELKASRKSRNIRLEIHTSGLRAIKPWLVPDMIVERFIRQKASWIIKSLASIEKEPPPTQMTRENISILKRRAAKLIIARLEFFNEHYDLRYKSLSVRNQKTCWGSCSPRGTLSFNCRLALLPEHLLDYIVVHELCHLKEMNHSARFWKLVGEAIPDYKERRHELKKHRFI